MVWRCPACGGRFRLADLEPVACSGAGDVVLAEGACAACGFLCDGAALWVTTADARAVTPMPPALLDAARAAINARKTDPRAAARRLAALAPQWRLMTLAM